MAILTDREVFRRLNNPTEFPEPVNIGDGEPFWYDEDHLLCIRVWGGILGYAEIYKHKKWRFLGYLEKGAVEHRIKGFAKGKQAQ